MKTCKYLHFALRFRKRRICKSKVWKGRLSARVLWETAHRGRRRYTRAKHFYWIPIFLQIQRTGILVSKTFIDSCKYIGSLFNSKVVAGYTAAFFLLFFLVRIFLCWLNMLSSFSQYWMLQKNQVLDQHLGAWWTMAKKMNWTLS